MAPVRPTCLAFILCESVETDAAGNVSLRGAFGVMPIRGLPSLIGPFTVWVQLTDGNGETPLTIEIERIGSELFDTETMWIAGYRARFRDPRQVLDYRLIVPSFIVQHDGLYRITLRVHDSPLAIRYFVVTRVR